MPNHAADSFVFFALIFAVAAFAVVTLVFGLARAKTNRAHVKIIAFLILALLAFCFVFAVDTVGERYALIAFSL